MLIACRLVRYRDATCAIAELFIGVAEHAAAKYFDAVCRGALWRSRATAFWEVRRRVAQVGLSGILSGREEVDDGPLAAAEIGDVLIPADFGHVTEGRLR